MIDFLLLACANAKWISHKGYYSIRSPAAIYYVYWPHVFVFVLRKRRPCVSKKNCLPFNENFPAEKAYRLLESILATKYSRHKLFIDRTQEWFPVQNAFFVIPSHTILTINLRRLAFEFCLLFENNTGKFTRGNLQEFQHQVSSHSEAEQITRVSSPSSIIMGRNAWSVMSYYITKRCCCLMCV